MGCDDTPLGDDRKGGDKQIIGHICSDELASGHLDAKHRTKSAVNRTKLPTDVREEFGREGDHDLAVEVVLDAIALDPSAEMAVEGLFLESPRSGDTIMN